MKTLIHSGISLLILGSLTLVSCKDKNENATNDSDVQAVEMPVTDTIPADTIEKDTQPIGDNSTGNAQGTGKSGIANKKTNGNTATGKQGTAKKSDKSGYSAPDGTDAENTDGDMYTKNDNTRMPSGGTPIK